MGGADTVARSSGVVSFLVVKTRMGDRLRNSDQRWERPVPCSPTMLSTWIPAVPLCFAADERGARTTSSAEPFASSHHRA